jgi:serine/threonine protein kinase
VTRRIGSNYVLERELGSGGTGVVWLGRQCDSGARVAIKMLQPELAGDPRVVDGFLRERRVLMSLDHPTITRVHDLVAEGESLAIVMELVPGGDLRDRLRRPEPIGDGQIRNVMDDLVGGLRTMHRVGVIHRDLKPQNILLTHWGATGRAKLTDFGISEVVALRDRQTAERLAETVGTPLYMAPETVRGEAATTSTDVYSVGCVFYELLGGRPPFAGESDEIMAKHLDEVPARLPAVPETVWGLVAAMLHKDIARRPSASQCAAVLQSLAPDLALRGVVATAVSGASGEPWWTTATRDQPRTDPLASTHTGTEEWWK